MTGELPLNQVIVGDCIELLRDLPDESIHLIIADPPYNLDKDFGQWKEKDRQDEWLPWCKTWLIECQRVLAPTGNIFVYGIHHHLCWLQCFMIEIGLLYRRQIIWYYENGFAGYSKRSLAAHYEPLLWFSKTKNYTYTPIREPYKSTERLKYKVTKKDGTAWTPHPDGRLAGDVWSFPTLAGRRFRDEKVDHPTQKPLSITNRLVEHFSKPDEIVLAPFCGSGTECVSAHMKGRHYIGFDLNPNYVDLAEKRIADASQGEILDLISQARASQGNAN